MHPAIQEYKDNKAKYDADYAIGVFVRQVRGSKLLAELALTPQFLALEDMCTNAYPFGRIMACATDFNVEELEWLVDAMPSCFHRARVMDVLNARKATPCT